MYLGYALTVAYSPNFSLPKLLPVWSAKIFPCQIFPMYGIIIHSPNILDNLPRHGDDVSTSVTYYPCHLHGVPAGTEALQVYQVLVL